MGENLQVNDIEAKSLFLSKLDGVDRTIAAEFQDFGTLAEKWVADLNSDQESDAKEYSRHNLLNAASLGLITGDSADALAIQLGLEALSHKPDYDAFKPTLSADWTLRMALAWIEYRNLERVIEQTEKFRAKWSFWRCRPLSLPKDGEPNGYFVKHSYQLKYQDPDDLSTVTSRPKRACQKDFWQTMSEGRLSATGRQNGNVRQPIPPEKWQDLEPSCSGNADLSGSGEEWHDVTLRRDDILKEWPKRPRSGVSQKKRQAVLKAIGELTEAALRLLHQKVRESRIVSLVSENSGLSVSDRYVRTIWKEVENRIS